MPSSSARVSSERPFYDLHANAYDALITDSAEPWVQMVDERLQSAGFSAGRGLRHGTVAVGGGATLVFRSRPTWSAGHLVVEEHYELELPDGTTSVHDYLFEMRPWKRSEIESRLVASGFTDIQVLPGVVILVSQPVAAGVPSVVGEFVGPPA